MASTTAYNSKIAAKSGQPEKKNASCVLGLTISSSGGQISEILTLQNSTARAGVKNGGVYESGVGHVKALSGGTFAYGPAANKWVMLGNAVCLTLSGTSNTVLKSGAAHFFRRPIHFKTGDRITFLDSLTWTSNTITGCTYAFTRNATLTAYGNDVAANLSRVNRSSLFYMVTGKLATETVYPTLNLW